MRESKQYENKPANPAFEIGLAKKRLAAQRER
jgi:hypothetical protein